MILRRIRCRERDGQLMNSGVCWATDAIETQQKIRFCSNCGFLPDEERKLSSYFLCSFAGVGVVYNCHPQLSDPLLSATARSCCKQGLVAGSAPANQGDCSNQSREQIDGRADRRQLDKWVVFLLSSRSPICCTGRAADWLD